MVTALPRQDSLPPPTHPPPLAIFCARLNEELIHVLLLDSVINGLRQWIEINVFGRMGNFSGLSLQLSFNTMPVRF